MQLGLNRLVILSVQLSFRGTLLCARCRICRFGGHRFTTDYSTQNANRTELSISGYRELRAANPTNTYLTLLQSRLSRGSPQGSVAPVFTVSPILQLRSELGKARVFPCLHQRGLKLCG